MFMDDENMFELRLVKDVGMSRSLAVVLKYKSLCCGVLICWVGAV